MANKFNTILVRRSQRGFTLIEMLVVLAIVSILASLITAGVMAARARARIQNTEMRKTQIIAVIHSYETDFNDVPPSVGEDGIAGCERLMEVLQTDEKNGPYLRAKDVKTVDSNGNGLFEIADDWGKPFRYLNRKDYGRQKPNRDSYRLWSVGPDGVDDPLNPGSDDIVNWDKNNPE